jgi:hypothetical protein
MKLLVYLYLAIGILFILLNKRLNRIYIGILMFFLAKMIFNYRKCTISYLECKLRNVKREEGYLNKFMDSIIDVREEKEIILLYIFAFIIIFYYYTLSN